MSDKHRLLRYLPAIMDACIIIIAYFLAYYLRFYRPIFPTELGYYYPISHYAGFLLYIIPINLVIYNMFRLYSDYLDGRIWNKIFSLILANIVGIILFLFVIYLQKEYNISRQFLLLFFIINTALGVGSRMIIKLQSKLKQRRR